LIPALRSLIKDLQESNGVNANLKVIGDERRFSPEVELLIFRIVQEAFNNIRRHAYASEVNLLMELTEDKIKVTISDNGQGFELQGRVDDLPRIGKLGLIGIQERARLLNGTLEVKSEIGKGTTLIIEVST
jgi:two-component system sensor histidine kinase DegS